MTLRGSEACPMPESNVDHVDTGTAAQVPSLGNVASTGEFRDEPMQSLFPPFKVQSDAYLF